MKANPHIAMSFKSKANAATRRFTYSVVEVVNSKRTPQQKLGAICRLARKHRGLAGTDVAQRAGCGVSRVYSLESGETGNLECYRQVIDALCLDHETLIRFVTLPQTINASQAEGLLLDNVAIATDSRANETARSPALEEFLNLAWVRDVLSVVQMDWSPARKLGEICRLTRYQRKWTQRAIGSRVGRSNMYISELEDGKKPLDRYPPVIRALGLDDEKLLTIINGQTTEHTALEALLRAAIDHRS